ncbi:uncharacterized protein LOC117793480 [Drosophila innubila]|uniref:uncharacterized protein LOC117793480 n=1 Tax=Drosophila innubila TaxID=198719 RepID=UPI00148CD51A|nr:uncharacterized protein LOC117793480 [Drosophila innubila]
MDKKMNLNSAQKENKPYRVVFDVQAEPESHISTRPEDNGAEFRRFVVEFSSPLDKRLFVRSVFNGPTDPNFYCLIEELRAGLHRVGDEQDYDNVSTTDTSSETEMTVKSL